MAEGRLPAIRIVLGKYRSESTVLTQEEIEAAWAEHAETEAALGRRMNRRSREPAAYAAGLVYGVACAGVFHPWGGRVAVALALCLYWRSWKLDRAARRS